MALNPTQQSSVFRHLSYSVVGLFQISPVGGSVAYGNAGMRYFSAQSEIMYRINQLAPNEECRITGSPLAALSWQGLGPTVGDTVTVNVSGGGIIGTVTVIATVPAQVAGQPPFTYQQIAALLAQMLAGNAAFIAAGFQAKADYGAQPFSQSKLTAPILSIIGPANQNSFTITTASTGNSPPFTIANGTQLPPFLSVRQVGQINTVWGYLAVLDYLEAAWLGSTTQMSLNKADDTTFRHDEYEQRQRQYFDYNHQLAKFLGVPEGKLQNPANYGGCGSVSW